MGRRVMESQPWDVDQDTVQDPDFVMPPNAPAQTMLHDGRCVEVTLTFMVCPGHFLIPGTEPEGRARCLIDHYIGEGDFIGGLQSQSYHVLTEAEQQARFEQRIAEQTWPDQPKPKRSSKRS